MPFDPEAFKQFERSGWTQVAGRYHDSFARLTSQAVEPLLDAARVGAGTRLLDVACGPGHAVAAAARRGARPLGVDFAGPMVEEARRRHPELEFRQGDAEALPFGDGTFDAVTIGFGMLHFARPERALAEAHRLLRPGGRVAFTVWDAPERAITFGLVHRAIEARGRLDVPLPEGPPFFQFSDPDQCRQTLEAAGFVSPQVAVLPVAWEVDSADALVTICMEGGVRTRALLLAQTPEALAAIREAVRESARPYERDGRLHLPTPAVLAAAEKPRPG